MLSEKPVTAQEIADHFDVTVQTVNRWVRERRIPFIRPSQRIVRFRLSEVEQALSSPAKPCVKC